MEISGIEINELHSAKILFIDLILLIFHFEISGIFFNDEQRKKIYLISVTLFIFHLEISGNLLI